MNPIISARLIISAAEHKFANGGVLEHAQETAAHESPRTTKLYIRTKERLTQGRRIAAGNGTAITPYLRESEPQA